MIETGLIIINLLCCVNGSVTISTSLNFFEYKKIVNVKDTNEYLAMKITISSGRGDQSRGSSSQ